MASVLSESDDEVRLNRTLISALRKLEELKFVRQFEQEPPSWEVRRIIKARLPLDDLERLRESLVAAATGKVEEALKAHESYGSANR